MIENILIFDLEGMQDTISYKYPDESKPISIPESCSSSEFTNGFVFSSHVVCHLG